MTIHNGVPDMPFEPPPVSARQNSEPSGKEAIPAVIMVARFAPQKNQAMLLDAAARIRTPFRIQFAGTGPTQPEIASRASRLGLDGRVEFLGDRSDIVELLRSGFGFRAATHWEGFPLSILEAMRAGLPVVASDVGGIRESVVDGQNGFLSPRGDTAAFTSSLERLLTDEQLRRQMSQTSRRMFEENFTRNRCFAERSMFTARLSQSRLENTNLRVYEKTPEGQAPPGDSERIASYFGLILTVVFYLLIQN